MGRLVSLLVSVAVLGALGAACGEDEPSYTWVKCNELAAAHAAQDSDRLERAVESMLDIGTEEEPRAVEPKVYAHVLLLQDRPGRILRSHSTFRWTSCWMNARRSSGRARAGCLVNEG
jgi:hypothetical protein